MSPRVLASPDGDLSSGAPGRRPAPSAPGPEFACELPAPESSQPLVLRARTRAAEVPRTPGEPAFFSAQWRAFIDASLLAHGAILFRGFPVASAPDFEAFITELCADRWANYREPATPRSHVDGHIYTSTEYDPRKRIYLHNENAHCMSWPLKLFFFCQTPAPEGGATPIADCRRMLSGVSPATKELFRARHLMHVRNFGYGFGFPWQTVFGTTERDEVARYCADNGMEHEWKDGDKLSIRYVRPAFAPHPHLGEDIWFNHGTFFHPSTTEPQVQRMLRVLPSHHLPFNTLFGDGTPIEAGLMDELRAAYDGATSRFTWEAGDILLLDNMITAHGRDPYAGERRVLVGMAEPVHRQATPSS
jgi:alpha-ketoglutarate-dependent taurine dioxygenase